MPRLLLPFLLCLLMFTGTAQNTQRTQYCDLPVYFDFGADSLTANARACLQQLAIDIVELPGLDIRLTAHTDAVGGSGANLALSKRRARAVSDFLTAAGIPDSTLQQVGKGEAAPVANNDTPEGRQQNRRVEVQVYSTVPMRALTGQISSQTDSTGVPATVHLSTDNWRDSLKTDTTGQFSTLIPALQPVRLDAFAKGFFFDTKILAPDASAADVEATLPLPPADAGAKLPVKRLHFVGDQAVLLRKSLPELDRLLRFMELNADLEIIIHGHVNVPNAPPVSPSSDNFKLSEDRAKHIYEFLTSHGIDAARLSWKAHGNWEMRYPRARSEGQQAANRRVEIEVR
ncbi:MAG: OmpA family protein [Phaeodactylibacter xiamenensis]|uniref:OmpA family protein n=1 Tax=Phaeodactylibacter xiamenensis TaxID=1524460 RepID=UPI001363FF87|nr:OmpA family protein [Phaeodactylibacter xiamenensis]MCR9051570.1 OmpA family protein [bacterium]